MGCQLMTRSLVIGYGNSLRSDDRIGLEVAGIIDDWNLPHVQSLGVHQLTPELTAELAEVDLVIFIDAYAASVGDEIKVLQIEPSFSITFRSHFGDPRALLSLTQALFGRCPQAWWVLVPGINFELGDCLTPTAQQGIEQASNMVGDLLNEVTKDLSACSQELTHHLQSR